MCIAKVAFLWFIDPANLTAISTAGIFIFTVVLAVVGVVQSRLTRDAIKVARDEFTSTHRPKIRIKHVWLTEPLEANKPVMIQIASVNTGSVDAHVYGYGIATHVVLKHRYPPNDPFIGGRVIAISSTVKSGITITNEPLEAGTVSPVDIADIRGGRSELYCFAYVEYLEPSGQPSPRKTSCCRVLRPDVTDVLTIVGGAFVVPQAPSEHEYAD